MNKAPKAIVIYSGGMDSFTVLHKAMAEYGMRVHALSFNYNQRHCKELHFAKTVANNLGIPHTIVPLDGIRSAGLMGNSALTSDMAVPEGHYTDESMKQTVVPGRNIIFLALAVSLAEQLGAKEVWCGVHAGDHAIYPDCRATFIDAMSNAAAYGTYNNIKLVAPFQGNTKGEILAWGLDRGLDYGQTWTCYAGKPLACGRCGSCVERREGFDQNGVADPLEYEAPEPVEEWPVSNKKKRDA